MPRQADRGLHFININPNSVQSRSELIHEVRSHAGRWRWQQLRQNGEQDGDVNPEEEHHQPNLPENSDEGTMAVNDDEDYAQTVGLLHDAVSGVAWGSRHSDSVDRSQHGAHEVANIMLDRSGTSLWEGQVQNNPIRNTRYTQTSLTLNNNPSVSIFDPFQTAVPSPIPMEFTSANNKYGTMAQFEL
ncbi:hypothetical protein N7541_000807 [Penicillium brevicompactum]|uniref:Uncharacterized protein n=1 Tax=Penicillium brevicompactum TaxID=5074 RepID=A0A9W9V5D2_PENBR|nr:hypothetical protein N7541_000807 [Penicillium brevicompactum]